MSKHTRGNETLSGPTGPASSFSPLLAITPFERPDIALARSLSRHGCAAAVDIGRRAVARRRESGCVEDARKRSPLFGKVDRIGGGAQNGNARPLKPVCEAERRLAAELHNHADEFTRCRLGVDDFEHVFERERLKVKPVARVVVGRDRLGVAVDHDRFEPGVAQRIKLLPDPKHPGGEWEDIVLPDTWAARQIPR